MRCSEFKQRGSGALLFLVILSCVLGLFWYNYEEVYKLATSPEQQTAETNAKKVFLNSPYKYDVCDGVKDNYATCYGASWNKQVSIQCRSDVVMEHGCRKPK